LDVSGHEFVSPRPTLKFLVPVYFVSPFTSGSSALRNEDILHISDIYAFGADYAQIADNLVCPDAETAVSGSIFAQFAEFDIIHRDSRPGEDDVFLQSREERRKSADFSEDQLYVMDNEEVWREDVEVEDISPRPTKKLRRRLDDARGKDPNVWKSVLNSSLQDQIDSSLQQLGCITLG
jgi:hypothetical protein